MGDWDRVGESNWRLEDGAVVADNRTSEGAAHLLSKESYKDFMLHIEFWASDDANSGIFLRCNNREKINDRACYEANIYDQRKDPSYGTGAIVRHVEIDPMPKAGGKWNAVCQGIFDSRWCVIGVGLQMGKEQVEGFFSAPSGSGCVAGSARETL